MPWVASAAARKGVISETAFSLAYLLALCRVLLLGEAVANQVKFAGWNENIVGVLTCKLCTIGYTFPGTMILNRDLRFKIGNKKREFLCHKEVIGM